MHHILRSVHHTHNPCFGLDKGLLWAPLQPLLDSIPAKVWQGEPPPNTLCMEYVYIDHWNRPTVGKCDIHGVSG